MNLYFRLLGFLISSLWSELMLKLAARDASSKSKYAKPTDVCISKFRVWPNDLDLNFHMNNGRYLTIMDLARFDLLRITGLFWPIAKRKYYPVVGESQLWYFKSLSPFQSFEIHSQIEFWDDRWFVISQKFVVASRRKDSGKSSGEGCSDAQVVALGVIRGQIRGPQGLVTTAEVLALLGEAGVGVQSPEPKKYILDWMNQAKELRLLPEFQKRTRN